MVPVNVLVRDLAVPNRTIAMRGISTLRTVGLTPGSIQLISLVWVNLNSISSTSWSAPTVRLIGASSVSGGLPPMKWFCKSA